MKNGAKIQAVVEEAKKIAEDLKSTKGGLKWLILTLMMLD